MAVHRYIVTSSPPCSWVMVDTRRESDSQTRVSIFPCMTLTITDKLKYYSDRRGAKAPDSWNLKAGDVIVSNWASWIELLWLAFRFVNPSNHPSWMDEPTYSRKSITPSGSTRYLFSQSLHRLTSQIKLRNPRTRSQVPQDVAQAPVQRPFPLRIHVKQHLELKFSDSQKCLC